MRVLRKMFHNRTPSLEAESTTGPLSQQKLAEWTQRNCETTSTQTAHCSDSLGFMRTNNLVIEIGGFFLNSIAIQVVRVL